MLDDVLIMLPDLSLDPTEETLRCTPEGERMLLVIFSTSSIAHQNHKTLKSFKRNVKSHDYYCNCKLH